MIVTSNNLNVLPQGGRLVLGNWKMHGSLSANAQLIRELSEGGDQLPASVRCGVCVPFPYLAQVSQLLEGS